MPLHITWATKTLMRTGINSKAPQGLSERSAKSGWLGRPGGVTLAWRAHGPAAPEPGQTWLVIHGGPGSGANAGMLAPFDLTRQRVVLFDQRGAGQSRPRGQRAGNQTAALVRDIEALRQHLGIARWSVLAGSWGATLALHYAAAAPQAIAAMVLRGGFRASLPEVFGLFAPAKRTGPALPGRPDRRVPGWGAGPVRVSNWPGFLFRLGQLFRSGTRSPTVRQWLLHWSVLEHRAAMRGMQRAVRHLGPNREATTADGRAIRRQWSTARRGWRRLSAQADAGAPVRPSTWQAWHQKFSVQAHYLAHRCFSRPTALDAGLRALGTGGQALALVHGRYDCICPPANSERWYRRAQAQQHPAVQIWRVHAGHLGSEPAMLQALRAAVTAPDPRARAPRREDRP